MSTSIKQRKHKNFLYIENKYGIEIVKYLGNERTVEIPSKIYGKQVTSIGNYAFKYNKSIEEVIFPQTLKMIKKEAFAYCSNLECISLPKSLKVIHEGAFECCSNLVDATLYIPYFKYIGSDAFFNCYSLKDNIGKIKAENIDKHAFCCSYYYKHSKEKK